MFTLLLHVGVLSGAAGGLPEMVGVCKEFDRVRYISSWANSQHTMRYSKGDLED
jgi:hypothetical protein